jgi:dihydroflavonol-4-reductase
MRIFITGATGFIGRYLVARLAGTEHRMRCLVRRPERAAGLVRQGAEVVQGDITDKDAVLAAMRGCDWVVHLAGIYSMWEPDPRRYVAVNVRGTRNVMEAALECGVAKVLYVSTVAVWGKVAQRPFDEETPVAPFRCSDYARTKLEGERIAWELHRARGLPLVVVYPGAALGAGDDKPTGQYAADVVAGRLPVRVLKDTVLTYVHVRDVAEAIVRALEKPDNLGEKYIVAHRPIPLGEYTEMLAKAAGTRLPRLSVPDWLLLATATLATAVADVTKRPPPLGLAKASILSSLEGVCCDGSKAERELGFTYTPIEEAIAEAVASLRQKNETGELRPDGA